MRLSIGKSSLARAASINTRPMAQAVAQQPSEACHRVSVESIRLIKGQKRRTPTEELKKSIGQKGILEPLLLAQTPEQELLLLSGACRLTAAKELGLDTVPAVIVNMTAAEASVARREIARFSATEAKATPQAQENVTAVGQAMPAWLL